MRMTKEWSMDDRLEDMMLEVRRHSMAEDEKKNVGIMRDGLRLAVSGIELVNNRFGVLDLDGWSSEVNRELSKHDVNLARIYRKYWRRSASRSPEAEIAVALLSSMGLHHMKRVMAKKVMTNIGRGGFPPRRSPPGGEQDLSSSEDEDVPERS